MADRRDQILNRLFDVLSSIIPGAVVSNRGELPADMRPGIILLDAHEQADVREFDRGRLARGPNMVQLMPEIYIAMDDRKPKNENVGKDLNAYRVQILKAVLFDAELIIICGTNGEIRYTGCVTDLSRQLAMNGEMGIMITFVYPLIPGEL